MVRDTNEAPGGSRICGGFTNRRIRFRLRPYGLLKLVSSSVTQHSPHLKTEFEKPPLR